MHSARALSYESPTRIASQVGAASAGHCTVGPVNTSIGMESPGAFTRRASMVWSGATRTSASVMYAASYAASYAVRLAHHAQIRYRFGPCRLSSSNLEMAVAARDGAMAPAFTGPVANLAKG